MAFSGIMGIFGILYLGVILSIFVLVVIFLVKSIQALNIYISKNKQENS